MQLSRRGFTMIELLVVIGIIVLLLAILLPVVSQVRMKAFVAQTQAEMMRIMGGIQAYYHDHNAYPGPLTEATLAGGPTSGPKSNLAQVTGTPTSSENLVLGLLGFLARRPDAGTAAPPLFMGVPQPSDGTTAYTPGDVSNLNLNHPKSFHYIDYVPEELSQSGYAYGAAGVQRGTDPDPGTTTSNVPHGETITDSNIPEFLDHIPDAMPILYMRAQVGAPTPASNPPGPFIAPDNSTPAQYHFTELFPYGFNNISQVDFNTKNLDPSNPAKSPLDMYFQNPAISTQPRGKDSFILISAGIDRMYGTKDDIIVTP